MGDLAPRFIPVNCRRRAAEGVDPRLRAGGL